MRSITRRDGWYWPSDDEHAHRLIPSEAARDIPKLLKHASNRGLIVQAGGNTGWWAKILAGEFGTVITAEPEPVNYACLLLNQMPPNVRSMHAALGDNRFGWADIELHEPGNYGAARLDLDFPGPVRMVTIDSIPLPGCGAIWLDVEGFELHALMGAEKTIREHLPMIAVEEKGLASRYGGGECDIEQWLASLNYLKAASVGRDNVYLPA